MNTVLAEVTCCDQCWRALPAGESVTRTYDYGTEEWVTVCELCEHPARGRHVVLCECFDHPWGRHSGGAAWAVREAFGTAWHSRVTGCTPRLVAVDEVFVFEARGGWKVWY